MYLENKIAYITNTYTHNIIYSQNIMIIIKQYHVNGLL